MTTVTELIEELRLLPGDFQVVLSKDAEGNGFSPFGGTSPGFYDEETTYSGDFREEEWEDEPSNAVCLWPIN